MATAAAHPMAWADDAACLGMDPALFFPDGFGNENDFDEQCTQVCAVCPVRGACLDWALRHERDGYWAGTTPKARRRMRRSLGLRLVEAPPSPLDPDPSPTSEVPA